jgi:hypothetical protein
MDDVTKIRGTTGSYKPNPGGQVEIPYPVKGVVKDNIDAARTGRIRVYIEAFSGLDPDNADQWVPVSFLPPFFGGTTGTIEKETTEYGKYKENPHAYGFWAQPPDIESEVVCIFLNGKKDFGFYIGCVPAPGLTHMVPAIGSTNFVVLDSDESTSYGGASVLPVVEMQPHNNALANSRNPYATVRPTHKRVATQLFEQGLIKDKVRGAITSSSMRESPSRVFGISTPGRPLYKGGFDGTDEQIAAKIPNANDKDLKIIGRRGGHSLVMDDGDFDGKNNLVRVRTSAGHQITMSDDGQTIFVIHSNGQSYVELGKEGTVDVFATNSVNIRTQGDLNFHADRKINFHAGKEVNLFTEKITVESSKDTSIRVGTEFKQHTVGDHTLKVDKKMSFDSAGDASMASAATSFVNGAKVNLNTGSTSLKPATLKPFVPSCYAETLFDKTKGWTPCPGKLKSITTRCPTHTPWPDHNKGVCCKGGCNASAKQSSGCSGKVSSCNGSVGSSCSNPVKPPVKDTVPESEEIQVNPVIFDKTTTATLIAQSATNAESDELNKRAVNGIATDSSGNKFAVIGKFGHTPTQLERAGYLKPGSGALAEKLISSGSTLSAAIPNRLFTGKDNINSVNEYLSNKKIQIKAEQGLITKGMTDLYRKGIISGKESSDQLGGLALTSAKFGSDKTIQFVNNPASNNRFDPIVKTYASGNYAAIIADRKLSAAGKLSNATDDDSTNNDNRGSSNSLFEKIKKSYAPLGTGPLNLATNKITDFSFSNERRFSSFNFPVLDPEKMKTLMQNKKISLKSAAYFEADAEKKKNLNNLFGSLNTSNLNDARLPAVGVDTFDRTEINEKVKTLLGSGVPVSASSFTGTSSLDPNNQNTRLEELQQERDAYLPQKNQSYQTYLEARKKYGPDSIDAKAAEENYKTLLNKLDSINTEIYKLKG